MTRVAGGGSGGGGGNYPPSGTMNIVNGGPGNAAPLEIKGNNWPEFSGASDDSGNTLMIGSDASGDYLFPVLENNSTGSVTNLTLSGFGTFSSQPEFHILGYDIENSAYWIIFQANGGSGSITNDILYPMTISGSTITLGSSVTPPVVGGKTLNLWGGVSNGKICMIYSDTATYECDTARVYDISGASWAAPSGTNKSPYAVNTNATLDSNLDNESAFASGARSDKGYWSLTHADKSPCFVKFDYSAESFTDLTSQVPVGGESNDNLLWSMGIEPNGDYAVGYYETNSKEMMFIFDIANDEALLHYQAQQTSYKKVIAGDLSNGNIGRIFYCGADPSTALKSLYINETGAGTLAGVEAIGNYITSNFPYGAGDVAFLFNIDGGGFTKYLNVQSLWNEGGYKKIMQEYTTSLEIIMLMPYFGGSPYRLLNPGAVHYTT